ncbi:SLATT domain-containing protein [Vagococcus fluvialis]|uniref:SLATT domain-containing protein n=1 Tax=Vagococcus fluvialis TaxID=2738 RepID=A0A7X6I3C9_9ENTE|nr:SLATT domain-containing protein [Vagococcus fluvialis]NKC68050.1 SLATT domain-containing protein [Vagococcus fluvialis]
MDNKEQKEKLRTQLREAYGRVTYAYTTQLKAVDLINNKNTDMQIKNNTMKVWQIILSAVSTGGILTTIIFDEKLLAFFASILSACSLGLNLYLKNFEFDKMAKIHKNTANELWFIRERYVSLLTDLDSLSIEQIKNIRDSLQVESYTIYKTAPKTDSTAYTLAQNALKDEEEQFFTNEELDKMLPQHLRLK